MSIHESFMIKQLRTILRRLKKISQISLRKNSREPYVNGNIYPFEDFLHLNKMH